MSNIDVMQDESINDIVKLVREIKHPKKLKEELENYHDRDIADALDELTVSERLALYQVMGHERTADVLSYLGDDIDSYLSEINIRDAADILGEMDADDAVDVLEQIDDEFEKNLLALLDRQEALDIIMIQSYEDDEVGSKMTTNYISITRGLTVKGAMSELIRQSGENDNIDTLYVVEKDGTYYGEIDLKDLIRARDTDNLEDLIVTEYPALHDKEKIPNILQEVRDYAEQSIPVLNSAGKLIGVLTAQDIIESVDDELSDDYVKLAGLTSEEDLHESLLDSMKKRMPWLGALLVLGLLVSSVVGIFEQVVAQIAIIVSFQSLVLDMAGNVGTQSLAVTIRVLMDEDITNKQRIGLIFKELRVGFANGMILGSASLLFIGLYIHFLKHYDWSFSFAVSFCVGMALLLAMCISSLVGTIVPILFKKINIDPAVASGPFITTINDLVAVVSYYGLAWILLINIMKFV